MSSHGTAIKKLGLCLILCLGVGFASSIFTQISEDTWYATLTKPPGTPPAWLFAPVWVILYILMGISLWLSYQSNASKHSHALFYMQLLLNLFWTFFFFGMQSIVLGMIDILLLDCAVISTIVSFWSVSRLAALLLTPYLAWILYATYLNIALLMMN